MADAFHEAAIPEPWTILGIRLRPLSLGHIIILNRIESPFVFPGREPAVNDLITGILLCSMTYEQGASALDDPSLPRQIRKWGRKVCRKVGWRGFIGLTEEINWAEKASMFAEYLKDGMRTPDFQYDPEKAKDVEAPAHQIVKVALLSKTNLTEQEILDRPWALSIADFMTLRAMDGQIEFVDHDELDEAKKQANALHARVMAGMGKNGGGKCRA